MIFARFFKFSKYLSCSHYPLLFLKRDKRVMCGHVVKTKSDALLHILKCCLNLPKKALINMYCLLIVDRPSPKSEFQRSPRT